MIPIQLHLLCWWKAVSRDLRNDHSQVTSFERASELVVIGSQHCQGHIFVSNSSQQNNCHRCIHSDVWRESGSSDHTRFLAGRTKRAAHKLSGVGGSSLDYEKLLSSVEKSMCSVPKTPQEFNTFVVREELSHLSCVTKLGILAVGYQKNIILKVANIAGKLNNLPDKLSRVVIQPTEWTLNDSVVRQFYSNLGGSNDRSLCIVSQEEDGHLLHLRSSSSGLRC